MSITQNRFILAKYRGVTNGGLRGRGVLPRNPPPIQTSHVNTVGGYRPIENLMGRGGGNARGYDAPRGHHTPPQQMTGRLGNPNNLVAKHIILGDSNVARLENAYSAKGHPIRGCQFISLSGYTARDALEKYIKLVQFMGAGVELIALMFGTNEIRKNVSEKNFIEAMGDITAYFHNHFHYDNAFMIINIPPMRAKESMADRYNNALLRAIDIPDGSNVINLYQAMSQSRESMLEFDGIHVNALAGRWILRQMTRLGFHIHHNTWREQAKKNKDKPDKEAEEKGDDD